VSVKSPAGVVGSILYIGGVGLSAYHGYKRHNGSVAWGFAWGGLAAVFPVIVPAFALGQGIGLPPRRFKGRCLR
jgi:hypothetical protein